MITQIAEIKQQLKKSTLNRKENKMDLVTANKQLTAIIEMLKEADATDFVAFDNFYKSIYNKALEVVSIINDNTK